MRLFLLRRDHAAQGNATGMALLAYMVCLAPLGCSRALRAAVLDLKRRQSRRAPDPRYDRNVCASETEQLVLALSAHILTTRMQL